MSEPRQGDVIRVPAIGGLTANKGHDLVLVFLGACPAAEEPNVAEYLRQLGFARTHVFEVTLLWENVDRWRSTHQFVADSPVEAGRAAVRLALHMREANREDELTGLALHLVSLAPIGLDGLPSEKRGQVFMRWRAGSGVALERLLDGV